MGNTYGRRKAIVCYPVDVKGLGGVTSLVGSSVDLNVSMNSGGGLKGSSSGRPRSGVYEDSLAQEDLLSSEYLDFHFIQEPETMEYIKANRVLFVLRGLPGSGKSYITRVLLSLYPDSVAFTADTYLLRHPEMILNPRVLEEAHRHCLNAVAKVVRVGQSPVIVDNTNVTKAEAKQYLRIARAFGYFGLVVEPHTPWRFSPTTLTLKTGKRVELAVIQNRLNAWQDLLPASYVCYLNCTDSKLVQDLVENLLQKVLRSDMVLDDLSKFHGKEVSWQGALNGYLKNRKDQNDMLKWIVAHGSDLTPESYYNVGRVVHFKIVSFLLTPKYVGAKVVPGKLKVLSEDGKKEMKREAAVMGVYPGSNCEIACEGLQQLSDWEELHAQKALPGAMEEVAFGVRVVRLGPFSFVFYPGREYNFRGLFTGCYL